MRQCSPTHCGRTIAGTLLLAALLSLSACTEAKEPMATPDTAKPVALQAGPIRLTLQDGELRYTARRRHGSRPPDLLRRPRRQLGHHLPRFTEMTRGATRPRLHGPPGGRVPAGAGGLQMVRPDRRDRRRQDHLPRRGHARLPTSNPTASACASSTAPPWSASPFRPSSPTDGTGEAVNIEFPSLVSPSSKLVGKHFRLLRYTAKAGCQVSCGVEARSSTWRTSATGATARSRPTPRSHTNTPV